MWYVHCAVNTAKWLLPFQRQLRAMKRGIFSTKDPIKESSVYFGGFDHIHMLREAGLNLAGKDILELGTGWYPVIPLMLRLAGARCIYLTDVERLLDAETTATAARFLLARKEDIAQRLGMTVAEIEKLLTPPQGLNGDELLGWYGMSYIVPFDSAVHMPQVDAVVSHTVLEHIPPHILSKLFREVRTGLRPGGLVSHGVDHSDHRANVDSRLSRIDFLRYSEQLWRLLCLNPQDYTNRLRHSDYIALFDETGYAIVSERKFIDQRSIEDARRLTFWGRFRDMDVDDLATSWSHLIARAS